MSKLKLIGVSALGPTDVQLFGNPTAGNGSFTTNATRGKLPEIVVGLDHEQWWRCLEVFHHEVNEYTMTVHGCRYNNSMETANNSAEYRFWFDHQQFAEMCAHAAYYTDKLGAALKKEWRASRKVKSDIERLSRKAGGK